MKNNHVYIIAEAGVNHNGSLDMAKKLVDAAAEAGADAVKFQTFRAETLVNTTAPKADYQKQATEAVETQFQMLKKLELDEPAHIELAEYCRSCDIQFLSTPFDETSLDFLHRKIGVPIIKIPSGEITNGPLLLAAARTKKPIILSTGMSTLAEIQKALEVLSFGYTQQRKNPSFSAFKSAFKSKAGKRVLESKVTLLHCTTEYPAPVKDVNLQAMSTMRKIFSLSVGYSDHTEGITIPIAAAALGASVIEKHFTLDRTLPGPDHRASLEPHELCAMVKAIRDVETAIGTGEKRAMPGERKNISIVRRSIVASRGINKGERFTTENITCKRPAGGISPMKFWTVLGKKAPKTYAKDEVIKKS